MHGHALVDDPISRRQPFLRMPETIRPSFLITTLDLSPTSPPVFHPDIFRKGEGSLWPGSRGIRWSFDFSLHYRVSFLFAEENLHLVASSWDEVQPLSHRIQL